VPVRNLENVRISLSQENPQPTTFFNTNAIGGTSLQSSTIQFIPTGILLDIIPTISNTGLIELDIDFSNSTPIFVELNTGTGNTTSGVGRNEQSIRTILPIPSGETRVLGGLVSRETREGRSGVPFLSQIPMIGWIFGSLNKSESKRNLLFFITPTIMQEFPQASLSPVPMNTAAYAYLEMETEASLEEPPEVVPVPEDLQQWLLEERPGLAPTETPPPAMEPPAQGERIPLPPNLERSDELLMNRPYVNPSPTPGLGFTGPALDELMQPRPGALGPSGNIRSGGAGQRRPQQIRQTRPGAGAREARGGQPRATPTPTVRTVPLRTPAPEPTATPTPPFGGFQPNLPFDPFRTPLLPGVTPRTDTIIPRL
jgi:hypothetical protein